ncbi:peptide chain release factor 2 [Pelagibacterales bacterium SAG-MED34]|nr:peptide chain release factor 2 [Pelagibacterales bacterium SAG-MED34]
MKELRSFFETQNIETKRNKLNAIVEDPKFWNDRKQAEKILKEKKSYDNLLDSHKQSEKEINELYDIFQLANEENDKQLIQETLKKFSKLKKEFKKLEIKCFLSNENDILDSYLEFHAGAGGTESQDWAEMLRRMYMKWAAVRDYKVELISEHKGDEAGIKSSVIKISGEYIYGFLKSESGIHRLVRISPFDSGARRHTSFASVWVYPVISEDIDIEILDKDLRIDTYRSSGAGGQHVNTTDSAVRITHMPSKIVVQCQNERSQHKNKETCMNMLKARLYEHEIQKRKKESDNIENSKSEIGWGHQIRSYVLHPYRMVKDNRTNYENSNPDKVLDGEIDDFLENSLYKVNA